MTTNKHPKSVKPSLTQWLVGYHSENFGLNSIEPELSPFNRIDILTTNIQKSVVPNLKNYSLEPTEPSHIKQANDSITNSLIELSIINNL